MSSELPGMPVRLDPLAQRLDGQQMRGRQAFAVGHSDPTPRFFFFFLTNIDCEIEHRPWVSSNLNKSQRFAKFTTESDSFCLAQCVCDSSMLSRSR